MSFKDLGTVFSELAKSTNEFFYPFFMDNGVKDLSSVFGVLNGQSLSGISNMVSVFREAGEMEKGLSAFKEVQMIMQTFDGSDDAFMAIGSALDGISLSSASAILGMTGLSEAELETALIAGGLTPELAAETAAIIASGSAATGAAAGFKALATSIINAGKGLIVFLFTNPVGQLMLIAAGVFALTKAYDALAPSFDKSKKAAEDSRSEYQNTVSELQSLNNELKTTKDRINELETKKTLSLTEEAELSKLKAQNAELETQIAIKEKLADVQEKTAAYNARQELTVKDEQFALDDLDNGGLIDAQGGGSYSQASKMYTDIVSYTIKKQEELNGLLQKEKDLTKEQARLANSGQVDSKQFKANEKALESLQKDITDHTSIISENTEEIQTNYQSLFDSSGRLISGNEQAAASCEKLFGLIEEGTSAAQETQGSINTILSEEQFAGVKDQLVEAAKAGTLDQAIKGVEGLGAEMDRLGVSTDDFKQSIQAIADQDLSNVEKQMEILNEEFQKGGANEEEIASRSATLSKFFEGKDEEDISNFYDYIKNQGIDVSQWSTKDLEYNWKISLEGAGEVSAQIGLLQTALKNAETDLTNLNTAMTQSNSATGLTAESVQNLQTMFADYDTSELFENTATGVRLNATAVKELNEQYANDQAQTYTDKLEKLNEKLAEEQEKLDGISYKDDSEGYIAQLDVVDELQYQISEVENLASVWKGATSAYNEYMQAQAAGNERDSLQGIAKDKESIENAISQGWGDSENVQSYLDLMLGEDRPQKASEAWQKLSDTIGDTGHSLSDYMSLDDDGNVQADNVKMWFDDIANVAGEGFTKIADDGTRTLDLTGNNVEILAEKFHTSAEFITLLAQALDDASNTEIKWNIDSDAVQNEVSRVTASVDEAKAKLQELQDAGNISDKVNLDFNMNTATLGDFESQISSLKSVKIDAEVDPAGAAALDALIKKTEQEYYLKINTDTGGQLDTAVEKVNEIKDRIEDAKNKAGESFDLKATVDGDDKIKAAAKTLSELPPEVTTAVGITVQDGGATGILNQLKEAPESISVPVNYETGETPNYQPEDKEAKVTYKKDSSIPDGYQPKDKSAKVKYGVDSSDVSSYTPPNKSATVTYHIKTVGSAPSGGGPVDGTAHPGGSAFSTGTARGKAFKSGYWGTNSSGVAIGGELGEEILVRRGHFYTIGSDSAELFKYERGDIIFNAQQSKEIFEKGKITQGKKRGTALAGGTAFATGNAFASGSKKGGSKKTLEKFQDWLSSLFDWIEIRLERQTDKISRYVKKADAALDSQRYGTAARNYNNAINATATQIEYQQTAAGRYQSQADKILNRAVKKRLLSRSKANAIRKGVANGTLDISEYNEKVREVAKDYQTWAEKAIDARDAIADLHDKIRDYIKDLKDVREEQRKNKVDRYNALQDIGISTYTSDAGTYHKLYNGQLGTQNATLKRINATYDAEVSNIISDNNGIRKNAAKSINSNIKSNNKKLKSKKTNSKTKTKLKAYNKALQNAQKAIKAKKKISSSDLKVIQKNSLDTYERLYAYNLSFDNLETARLERATIYASNSAEYFENISEQYEKLDDATKNRMDLNESKANNLTGKQANTYLNKVAKGYDKIIKNDKAEIKQYNKSVNTASKKIVNSNGRGKSYNNASSKERSEVNKYVKLAQSRVKAKVAIGSAIIKNLAKFNVKGYVSNAFLNACLNYNNALEHKRQAEAQLEIDEQTRIQERDAIAAEKFSNIEQEYNNVEDNINAKRSLTEAKQDTKTTTGRTLTANDYQKSINYNNESIENYKNEIKALSKALKSNSALYAENSQKRHEDEQKLNDYKVKLQELITTNEELSNSIIQIPYDKISDSLEKLDVIADYHKSIYDLKTAQSQDLLESEYLQQIADNQAIIDKYREQMTQLNEDLQNAKDNGGYYGGKSTTDWRKELREAATNLNQVEIENEKLKDSLRDDVYWRDLERAEQALERLEDIFSGIENLVSDDMYFDKNGNITEWGIDQIATLTKQFENARDQVDNYSDQIQNLNDLYADGQYTELEYTEKLGELQKKLLDSAASMKKYLNSIKEMYKDMDKAELDALFKLIDARADALDKKKACES